MEQGTRKQIVGGFITADYSMSKIKGKPIMLVLALKNRMRKIIEKERN